MSDKITLLTTTREWLHNPTPQNNNRVRELLDELHPPAARDALGRSLQQLMALVGIRVFRRADLPLSILEPWEIQQRAEELEKTVLMPVADQWSTLQKKYGKHNVPKTFSVEGLTIVNQIGMLKRNAQPVLDIFRDAILILKRRPSTRPLVGGNLNLRLVAASHMPMPEALGSYSASFDKLDLNASPHRLNRGGSASPVLSLIHEFGHRFWAREMSNDFKDAWSRTFENFYTTYYSRSKDTECFCEMFAFAMTKHRRYEHLGLYNFFLKKFVDQDRSILSMTSPKVKMEYNPEDIEDESRWDNALSNPSAPMPVEIGRETPETGSRPKTIEDSDDVM